MPDPLENDPVWRALRARDLESLETLSLLHRVAGFALGFFSLCFSPHLVIGLGILLRAMPVTSGEAPPRAVGALFALVGGGGMTFFVAASIGSFLASGWIKRREFRDRVFAVECLLLLFTPLGTALGVYGLVLLSKPHVRAAFQT